VLLIERRDLTFRELLHEPEVDLDYIGVTHGAPFVSS
jgi:hypothetical protein